MGFSITTIRNVPDGYDYYLYYLDNKSSLSRCVAQKIDDLGEISGERGAFIFGRDKYNKELKSLICEKFSKNDDAKSIIMEYPSVIIMPKRINNGGNAAIVPIPYSDCENAVQFMRNMINSINEVINAKSNSTDFSIDDFIISQIRDGYEGGAIFGEFYNTSGDVLIDKLKSINEYVIIKPSLFGIGLNVNKIISALLKKK